MANSDDRYEMLRDRELSKLSWVVKSLFNFPYVFVPPFLIYSYDTVFTPILIRDRAGYAMSDLRFVFSV